MSVHAGTIYVVDDDTSVRKGLENLLCSVGYQVHALTSLREFSLQGRSDDAACLVLDVRTPEWSGVDYPIRLAKFGGSLPVIFIARHVDVPTCVRAIKAGAVDFLEKPLRDPDVLDAVRQGINRDRAFRMAEARKAETRRRFAALRPREREVIEHVARGRLSKQIASDLGLSLNTVKMYRSKAMRRMGVTNLAELIRIVDGLANPLVAHCAPSAGAPVISSPQLL
ncbi:response regulator [Hyphomicrobium sp.]|uniref:response regulator transcription factor n=1 Tax=Hyphomicrobium sp. TaxID=82 RepID=UPI0025C48D94|nr:response regulator [Hyphomicrobium sp.]MCC7251923.1 response regulator transcription factor [Hyphomicrobium sp.]